jgi:hypothetical protein
MDKAKIRLSSKEMELVLNADWILTKNAIIEKTKSLFGDLQEIFIATIAHTPGADYSIVPPKISKGENYRGLPYLILDYPRVFDKENIFAIRTLFWWGHFFSITLHIAGRYKKMFEEKCVQAHSVFSKNGFFICINDDQWEHHFDPSNYIAASELKEQDWMKTIQEKSFIKIANKVSLHQWNDATDILTRAFKVVSGVILP